ncbi:MAG: MarR family transcriptional regulator [Coriobacteriia bacterium]|nr:MarR family transcriptional regulator [Coriobacteriia bacterium]
MDSRPNIPSEDARRAARSLMRSLPRLHGAMKAQFRLLGPGILPEHVHVLAVLAHGHSTVSRLAGMGRVSLPTASRTVDALERRGWVARGSDAGDRRRVPVSLTEEGRRELGRVRRIGEERLAERLSALTAEELGALRAGLEVIEKAFADETGTSGEERCG